MSDPTYEIGQKVRVKKKIFEQGEDHFPGLLADPSETLFVRQLKKHEKGWDLYLAHDMEMKNSFGVEYSEVEPIEADHE